jgi:hypothetical protein
MPLTSLKPLPQDPKLQQGLIPLLRLGAYDIPEVPALYGTPIAEVEKGIGIDLDGIVGSGLLAAFRVTLTDGGRAMWLEDMPSMREQAAPMRTGDRVPGAPETAPLGAGSAAPPAAKPPPPAAKPPPPRAVPPSKKAPEGPPIAQ